MRIFYDHQATSLQDAGGLSRYHFELVQALRSQSEVQIDYVLGWNRSVLPFSDLANEQTRIVSRGTALPPGYPRYALNALATAAYALGAGVYDVYHSTYQRVESALRHRCLVATHHDSTQERFPQLFRNARSIQARKRRLYARADAVICISEASKADLLHFYDVEEERIAVIRHGFCPLPSAAEAAPPDMPADPYVLYVGSRWQYKNFPALLRAFARGQQSPEVRLVAAGGGPWTREESQLLDSLSLRGRVTLTSRPSEAALGALYRGAALFVYPSLYEGFGFPPLEAMSVGCPVLVSRSSSLPEVCGQAAFYFEPGDEDSLAACLNRLLADERYRNSRVEQGFNQVKRYRWDTAGEATLRVYGQALARALPGLPGLPD